MELQNLSCIFSRSRRGLQGYIALVIGMGLFVLLNYIGTTFWAFKQDEPQRPREEWRKKMKSSFKENSSFRCDDCMGDFRINVNATCERSYGNTNSVKLPKSNSSWSKRLLFLSAGEFNRVKSVKEGRYFHNRCSRGL